MRRRGERMRRRGERRGGWEEEEEVGGGGRRGDGEVMRLAIAAYNLGQLFVLLLDASPVRM
jgi:hypothetical protein